MCGPATMMNWGCPHNAMQRAAGASREAGSARAMPCPPTAAACQPALLLSILMPGPSFHSPAGRPLCGARPAAAAGAVRGVRRPEQPCHLQPAGVPHEAVVMRAPRPLRPATPISVLSACACERVTFTIQLACSPRTGVCARSNKGAAGRRASTARCDASRGPRHSAARRPQPSRCCLTSLLKPKPLKRCSPVRPCSASSARIQLRSAGS